jgi:hypothetical protein
MTKLIRLGLSLRLDYRAVAVAYILSYLFGMSWLLQLWQSFLALHPWGYITTGVLALVVLIKRKAIGAAIAAVWKKIDAWFWEKMRTKLQLQPQTSQAGQTLYRTYRGTFQDYYYKSLSPSSYILELSSNGFSEKIPVTFTHILTGVKKGQFIEVDTEVTASLYSELVRRVRIDETD